eukprot:15456869-Alexandrium_andersonii.AAC.1
MVLRTPGTFRRWRLGLLILRAPSSRSFPSTSPRHTTWFCGLSSTPCCLRPAPPRRSCGPSPASPRLRPRALQSLAALGSRAG